MSRCRLSGRVLSVPLSCVLLGLFLPGMGKAQTPRDSLKEAVSEELVRSLPIWTQTGEAALLAIEAREERNRATRQVPVDTFHVGPFRLISEPRQKRMAERLFTEIWTDMGDLIRGSEDLLEPWSFLVRRAWTRDGMYLEGDSLAPVSLGWRFSRWEFRQTAFDQVGLVLSRGLPGDIRAWLASRPFPLSFSEEHLGWAAREMATAPSFVVRRCRLGDLAMCRLALGLTGGAGSWNQFYDATERRVVVSRLSKPPGDSRRGDLWRECVEEGDQPACDAFLLEAEFQPPFGPVARASFLEFSLSKAGGGSFNRLREMGPGSVEEKIAAAAGLPADALLASWRREVLSVQSPAWLEVRKTVLSVLFWLIFFGFLAARSTRWRRG